MTERISPQMRARLEALPDRNVGRRMIWTKEMDAFWMKEDGMTEQISPQMRARLEALPDRNVGRRMVWTKEMDAILLLGWTKKRHEDIAKIIELNVGTCRRRFEELTRKGTP